MPRIGKPSRKGFIGKKAKRRGWLGKTTGTQGSALVPDQDHSPVFYPSTTSTTTTSSTTTSTSTTTTTTV